MQIIESKRKITGEYPIFYLRGIFNLSMVNNTRIIVLQNIISPDIEAFIQRIVVS